MSLDSGDNVQKSHCMSWSRILVSARRFCERMKCWNFIGSRHEEHRRIVPHHVVVALTSIDLERETPGVTPSVRAATLAGNCRKTNQHVGFNARLEHGGLGVFADVLGDLETPECAASLWHGAAVREYAPG